MPNDVFISYSRDDRPRAEALAKALKVENLSVWWDAALETGQTFDEKIQAALQESKAVIVLWSPASVKSDWVRAESAVGRERERLVPVMVRRCVIPVPFNVIHTADLTGWSGDRAHPGYRDVVKQVKAHAGKSNIPPLKPPPNRALRTAWRTTAVLLLLGAIGAGAWTFRDRLTPAAPEDPSVAAAREAKARRDASYAQLASFGVTERDLETLQWDRIVKEKFKPETYEALKTASDAGDAPAQALLCAVSYWGVEDRPSDEPLAFTTCRKSAEAGDPAGQTYFGIMLSSRGDYNIDNPDPDVKTRAQNDLKAGADWMKKASDQGFAYAQVYYGHRLEEGRGVPTDPSQAEELYKQAQAKGLRDADFSLGLLYLQAWNVDPADKEALRLKQAEGIQLVRKAAEAGQPDAMYRLAELNRTGVGEALQRDLQQARAWMARAAEQTESERVARGARFALQTIDDAIAREAEEAAANPSSAPSPQ